MKATTRTAVLSILAIDETIDKKQIEVALNVLDNRNANAIIESDIPMTRKEAMKALGCCAGTITNYAREGLIRRVRRTTKSKGGSVKYCRADVLKLARGEHEVCYVPRIRGRK